MADWSKPPRVVAHRGASAEAPENTFAAFERALAHTSALELDVHMTKDGVPVVLHDPTLDRTTDGRGPVAERTWDEVRSLSAGAWKGPEFRAERVPSLEQVFRDLGPRALLDVELKTLSALYPGLVEAVGKLALRHGLRDRVLVTSFDVGAAHEFKVRFPEMRAGAIFAYEAVPEEVERLATWCDAVVLPAGTVRDDVVAAARRQGIAVLAWTVNDVRTAKALWERGVDAVVTDAPGRLAPRAEA